MLEIGWKSFVNHCRPIFEVVENLSTPSAIIFESQWKPSAIFGSLPKSSAIFGSCQQIFGNSESVEMKNLTHFTEKKLAGIQFNYIFEKKFWKNADKIVVRCLP